jgi:GAF domain-containing protein
VTGDETVMDGVADGLVDLDEVAWSSLDQLSRALRVGEPELDGTLIAILDGVIALVDGVDAAGLNLFVKGRFEPQVVRGAAPPVLDALQKRTGTGPCIDASRDQNTIEIVDVTADERWPEFCGKAVDLGVASMLCVPLWVDERRLGSLSLYGGVPGAFGPTSRNVANLFATHAALALADAQRTDQLRRVVANRDVIGQAKGILMATRRVTADAAFTLLKTTSQDLNRKLVDVAEIVASTGELPGR